MKCTGCGRPQGRDPNECDWMVVGGKDTCLQIQLKDARARLVAIREALWVDALTKSYEALRDEILEILDKGK